MEKPTPLSELDFREDRTGGGYGEQGLVLERIVSVCCHKNETVTIGEECDGYYHENLSQDDAIAVFKRFIRYIEENRR